MLFANRSPRFGATLWTSLLAASVSVCHIEREAGRNILNHLAFPLL
jgi:hypothetical protein